jgi:phosphatidylglycerophosphatase A
MKAMTRAEMAMLMRHPWGWLATGFGGGLSPFAPGTVGSLMALLPYLALRAYGPWAVLAGCVLAFGIGVFAADWVIARLGREDPGAVVIDEWAGQWIVLLPATLWWPSIGFAPPLWAELGIGFLLFRALDILKPWPASLADRRLHGGFGAMLDDALAAIYGALAMAFVLPWAWRSIVT